jgi:hypothetical protein
MKKFQFLVFICLLLITSCKVKYASSEFDINKVPESPNYSKSNYWAVLPSKIPEQLKPFLKINIEDLESDVFFVYPTLLIDKKNNAWNADINDEEFNIQVLNKSIKYQASAWSNVGRIFAPFYRQSHYRIYLDSYTKQSGDSYEIAYQDVKKAFEFYLENYNNGRPIILASHSQGSGHCKRLLKEFFDGKELQKQLVVAYLPGIRVLENEFKNLKPLNTTDSYGGYVAWNSYKRGNFPKKYHDWFKGGVTSNPITWDASLTSNLEDHKGLLYTNGNFYDKNLTVEIKDGLLWVSLPKVPKRFLLSFVKNYHFADINLFWKDINFNAQLRLKEFLKSKN